MNKQLKAYGSVFVSALLFFLMLDTLYFPALGDYVFHHLRLPAWIIQDGMHTHIAAIVFMILFIISLFLLKPFRSDLFSGKKTFWTFVLMVTVLYLSTAFVATSIKGNQEGLMAIAFEPNSGDYHYKYENDNITEFSFEVTLKNYSKDTQTFSITFENTFQDEDKALPMTLLDENYEPVTFTLGGKEEKTFLLTSEDYKVSSSSLSFGGSGGGGYGGLSSIILSNKLQSVRQTNQYLQGEVIYQNSILD